jgi:CRP-like cAMP-binding protein
MLEPYDHLFKIFKDFAGINREDFENVKRLFKRRSIEKNSFYIKSGEKSHYFAFIHSGLFRSFYSTENGEEFTKNFVKPSEMIAAYSSYLVRMDSIINIQALKDSVILDCNYNEFLAKTNGILIWEVFRRKLTELLFIQREIREFELLTLDATERYKKFLQKFKSIQDDIKDYHIASYLGITPVSFSRIQKKVNNSKTSIE